MGLIVPPGGFAGYSQMAPASRAALGRVGGTGSKRRRKRGGKKASATGRKRRRKTKSKRKLKFGSPAWRKKYMK